MSPWINGKCLIAGQRVHTVSNGVPAKCLIGTHDINVNLYQAHWTYVSRSVKISVGPLCTDNATGELGQYMFVDAMFLVSPVIMILAMYM